MLSTFDILSKRTNIELMEGERLGPTIKGPLYLVLLFSSIVISFSLGRYQGLKNPEVATPQVVGISDINASDIFQITEVTAKADSPKQFGCFYKQFNFGGEITSNGPGTAIYKWEGSNNSLISPTIIVFNSAETKYINTSWQVYGPGKRWIKLHVYSPNDIASAEIPFELDCQ